MTDRELMQQALYVFDLFYEGGFDREDCFAVIKALRERLAQPEQEPVAWLDGPHLVVRLDMRNRLNYQGPWVDLGRAIPDKWTPFLFTAPPQRKPLTDEEIERACVPLGAAMLSFTEVARAIEAAHGIGEKPDAA